MSAGKEAAAAKAAAAEPRLAADEIGRRLLVDRAAGLRWKLLTRRYGLSRSRLVQIFQQARRAQDGGKKGTVCPRCGARRNAA